MKNRIAPSLANNRQSQADSKPLLSVSEHSPHPFRKAQAQARGSVVRRRPPLTRTKSESAHSVAEQGTPPSSAANNKKAAPFVRQARRRNSTDNLDEYNFENTTTATADRIIVKSLILIEYRCIVSGTRYYFYCLY